MSTETISSDLINRYKSHLISEEKSPVTIEKYIRDIKKFSEYIGQNEITKIAMIEYKNFLQEKNYKPSSINSMLAAINSLLEFIGEKDCRVKFLKCQRQTYETKEKELTKQEYKALLCAAKKNNQLYVLMQTICGTGIRVSEVKYITVDAVKKGETTVRCKNKNRTILIPAQLQKLLTAYIKHKKISGGPVFVSKYGRPLDRSYIWKMMKSLCEKANVLKNKVFPHNLRKLFARTFYAAEKDIAKLADVLGHSNIETTRIYIMTSCNEHRKKMDRLGLVI